MKRKKKEERLTLSKVKPVVIFILLSVICILGLPLRSQNINLNGFISEDAWWHYRHVKEVVDYGHRLDPDIYEFTTLKRPMTYPPLFHYLVAGSYNLFKRTGIDLIKYTHYFNLIESILYIMLIYGLSVIITKDRLFSLIGALAASFSFGFIVRARCGELMPFVPSDLFALGAISIALYTLQQSINRRNSIQAQSKNPVNPALRVKTRNFDEKHNNIILPPDFKEQGFTERGGKPELSKKHIFLSLLSGALLGLSALCWNGTILIYLPLMLLLFLSFILTNGKSRGELLKLLLFCGASFLIISLPWYLTIALKYGINPHSAELNWFMKSSTVMRQIKSLDYYFLTSGISIAFIPIILLRCLFKRTAENVFIVFWIILAAIASFTGFRGYIAVVPIISTIALSMSISWAINSFFRKPVLLSASFIIIFLITGIIGYRITKPKIVPLDPANEYEIRTNEKNTKMLSYLKDFYPRAIALDHVTWVSEDQAIGNLKTMTGQYLEYLPKGASIAFQDVSRFYLSNETEAAEICLKYGVELIIARKQLLMLPQLNILFNNPQLNSEDYFKVKRKSPFSKETNIIFNPRGQNTMLFKMLRSQQLNKFKLIYEDKEKDASMADVVVYQVKNNSS